MTSQYMHYVAVHMYVRTLAIGSYQDKHSGADGRVLEWAHLH